MSYLYAAMATAGLVVYLARLARLVRTGRAGEPPRSHVTELEPMDLRLRRSGPAPSASHDRAPDR